MSIYHIVENVHLFVDIIKHIDKKTCMEHCQSQQQTLQMIQVFKIISSCEDFAVNERTIL